MLNIIIYFSTILMKLKLKINFLSEDDGNINKLRVTFNKEIKSFYKLFDGIE